MNRVKKWAAERTSLSPRMKVDTAVVLLRRRLRTPPPAPSPPAPAPSPAPCRARGTRSSRPSRAARARRARASCGPPPPTARRGGGTPPSAPRGFVAGRGALARRCLGAAGRRRRLLRDAEPGARRRLRGGAGCPALGSAVGDHRRRHLGALAQRHAARPSGPRLTSAALSRPSARGRRADTRRTAGCRAGGSSGATAAAAARYGSCGGRARRAFRRVHRLLHAARCSRSRGFHPGSWAVCGGGAARSRSELRRGGRPPRRRPTCSPHER